MKKYSTLFLPLIFFFISSCANNSDTEKDIEHDLKTGVGTKQKDSATLTFIDSKPDSAIPTRDTQSFLNRKNLKTDDLIKEYPANQKAAVRQYIEHLRKQWQNTPNPFIATYQGNEFGDYHHIIFKAANGIEYDFGQANNNYGQYKLHELSDQYEDNPKFLGQQFNIYWDWKVADFLCCEGEYDKAKAYLPSITKLELIKN